MDVRPRRTCSDVRFCLCCMILCLYNNPNAMALFNFLVPKLFHSPTVHESTINFYCSTDLVREKHRTLVGRSGRWGTVGFESAKSISCHCNGCGREWPGAKDRRGIWTVRLNSHLPLPFRPKSPIKSCETIVLLLLLFILLGNGSVIIKNTRYFLRSSTFRFH